MPETQQKESIHLREFFVKLVKSNRLKDSVMCAKALASLEKSVRKENLAIADLTETLVEQWIDTIANKLSRFTTDRYVESIHTIYKAALQSGDATNKDLFTNVKAYLAAIRTEGADEAARYKVDLIRRMAQGRTEEPEDLSLAIDVYLYSFYNAGMPIDDVVMLRLDAAHHSGMPHTSLIARKYVAPIRRYVFPLRQRQQTPKKIREKLDANFKSALALYGFRLNDKTAQEFIVGTWLSAARSCGISSADICACCSAATSYPRYKDIRPSQLSQREIDKIKQQVANSIIDMGCHWYAIRFHGDVDKLRMEIEQSAQGSYVKTYYPMDEICRKKGKKRVTENRPTIRDVLFLYTMPRTVVAIVSRKTDISSFNVLRDNTSGHGGYAVIPNAQMRRFSMLVSNGFEILSEDEVEQKDIELGSYVHITEGLFKGYNGRVVKVEAPDKNKITMLRIKADTFGKEMEQVLGKHLYVSIPQNLVSEIDPTSRLCL